ncbi:uncharacterized protein LOC141721011 [Apium graveolens]|uniref:uncharacterized protein LOC141721011 n=1 Tax=Apium graveolens TaxID=4045 RepID=UPI003D7908B8
MVRAPSIDKNGIKKGEWSKEEDDKLRTYINRYGIWNWRQLPKYAGLARCGKSCRLRWKNYLQPNVKRGNFTKEEEDIIINLHNQLGKKWSIFAKNLPGRTDNEIKNYWHTHLKKRTPGQNQILPSNVVKVESSCQTSLVSKEEINQESFDNNHQQISDTGLSQGITSPSISCCSVLSQSYDAPSYQESSANFWNQQLMIEDYELAQGSSCSEFSFGCSDDSNISNLMTAEDHATVIPSYECFDDFWSQPFETDYMNNSHKDRQLLLDPVNPSSPIADEVFLWSYDLSDESTGWNI